MPYKDTNVELLVYTPGRYQCKRQDCDEIFHPLVLRVGYRHPGEDPDDDPVVISRRQLREMVVSEVNKAVTAAFKRQDRQATGAICTAHDWKDRTDGRKICRACYQVEDAVE